MGKNWNRVAGDYADGDRALARARHHDLRHVRLRLRRRHAADASTRASDFAREQSSGIANFNPLTPTPGTALYDRLLAEGALLTPDWWLDPDYRYGDATFARAA